MNIHARLVAALEALPKKELGRMRMYSEDTGCYCAVGALISHEDPTRKEDWKLGFADAVQVLKLTRAEIYKITDCNDCPTDASRAERYTRVMKWARESA